MSVKTASDVIALAAEKNVKIVDFKFTDVPGTWQHFSIPVNKLDENIFQEGIGFDGSSIRGFQTIQESDMMLVPDPTTAFVDPIYKVSTLSLICDVRDPVTEGPYSRDPRYVARKAEAYLKSGGLADVSYWGPELEHFIFDNVRFDQNQHSSYYFIDSEEGIWNSGLDGGKTNLGHRPGYKQGYFPVPPVDTLQDLRSEAILMMMDCGIDIEVHHHEVATAGQGEIDMRFQSLTLMADWVMLHKYILKNVARSHGKTATFMPKPLFGEKPSTQLPNGGICRKQFYVGPEHPGHLSCDPGQAGQFRSQHIQGHSGTHTLRTQYEMGGYGATPAAVDCDAAARFTSPVPHRNEPRNGGPMMSFPRDA